MAAPQVPLTVKEACGQAYNIKIKKSTINE